MEKLKIDDVLFAVQWNTEQKIRSARASIFEVRVVSIELRHGNIQQIGVVSRLGREWKIKRGLRPFSRTREGAVGLEFDRQVKTKRDISDSLFYMRRLAQLLDRITTRR